MSMKKYEMSIVDEGYEDPYWSKIEEEKEKIIRRENIIDNDDIENVNFTDLITLKRMIILGVWAVLYKLFIYLGFGMIYFFLSIIVLIFTNLGERKPWQLSAYSIFNPNCERIPGTMSVSDIQTSMGIRASSRQEVVQENSVSLNSVSDPLTSSVDEKILYESKAEIRKRECKQNAKQPLNSACECGSNKKYKNCCMKIL